MDTTKEMMQEEAVKRLKLLRLHPNVISDFQQGKLNCSETFGALFWLDEEKKKIVAELEARCGGVVYHLIRSNTAFGVMVSCLYVSKYEEEWQQERENLRDGVVFAYVENLDYPDLSEFGSILVKPVAGGLVRKG